MGSIEPLPGAGDRVQFHDPSTGHERTGRLLSYDHLRDRFTIVIDVGDGEHCRSITVDGSRVRSVERRSR